MTDAAAWRELYDAAYDRVRGYVAWRLGGRADAVDDVLQDAWLTAARKFGAFDPARGPFAGWVCGLAANAVRNHLRTRRRRPTSPLETDPAAAPPTAADYRVADALAALPDRYERALRMKYLDDASVGDIAAATGDTPKAVESLLVRARDAFREAYDRGDTP